MRRAGQLRCDPGKRRQPIRVQDEGAAILWNRLPKGYVEKHRGSGDFAYVVGVTMDPEARNIERFESIRPFLGCASA